MTRASAPIWALVSGLPSGERKEWQLMALQAFIDESGSEPSSRHFVLGGFIANTEQWSNFSDEWKAALGITPELRYFKMSEAFGLANEFNKNRGWTERARDERLDLLIATIRKYVRIRVHISLRNDDFGRFIRDIPTPERRASVNSPYFMCCHSLILNVAAVQSTLKSDGRPLDYIFDSGSLGQKALEHWPTTLKIMEVQSPVLRPFVGAAPILRDEKQFLPLQAADLYVGQLRRFFTENHLLYMPKRRHLRQLESIPSITFSIGQDFLRETRQFLLADGARFKAANPAKPLISYNRAKRRKRKPSPR